MINWAISTYVAYLFIENGVEGSDDGCLLASSANDASDDVVAVGQAVALDWAVATVDYP